MTTDEMIAVLQAYKEGKQIQCKEVPSGNWCTVLPSWNFRDCEYRVKPEPHYRPFESAEEVMGAIREHGNWVKWKDGYGFNLIVRVAYLTLWLGTANEPIRFSEVFNNITFADGTPFGKLVEE